MGLAGCILELPCTADLRVGLSIHVIAADTGADLEATVIARDGAYVETLETFTPGVYVGAHERAGTYRVEVSSPGRAPAVIDQVEVEDDGCHVDGVSLTVRLAPAP